MRKRAQEEIMGFALIIIIVAVVILVFLSFVLTRPQKESVESYEVESFIQAFLQYTTDCGNYRDVYASTKDVLFYCMREQSCLDGRDSCEVLEQELDNLLAKSWKVGNETPVKGYEMIIKSESAEIYNSTKGVKTVNSKGALQSFSKSGNSIEIVFTAYY